MRDETYIMPNRMLKERKPGEVMTVNVEAANIDGHRIYRPFLSRKHANWHAINSWFAGRLLYRITIKFKEAA